MRYFILSAAAVSILHANPQQLSVAAGEAQAIESGPLLEVAVSDRAILNWESFSIGAEEITRFIQPGADSAVLNRVMGSDLTQIMGLLQANGQVYLVNPNGVVVGKDGRIDTAAFLATTMELKNEEFLSGEAIAFQDLGFGEIVNLGMIQTSSGPIVLLGHRVENSGEIHAFGGNVSIGSNASFLFDPTGDALLYIQSDPQKTETPLVSLAVGGSIESTRIVNEGGKIFIRSGEGLLDIAENAALTASENGKIFIEAEGLLETRGNLCAPSGEVRLLGKEVRLLGNAQIDVSGETQGGTVLIGGDYQGANPEIRNADAVYVAPSASINADANLFGAGGKVILWGTESNLFGGAITAKGGPDGGNGGFVEISSRGGLLAQGPVTTLAPKGKAGTLLLDPTDILIADFDMNIATFPPPDYTYAAGSPVVIDTVQLGAVYLAGGNVEINTSTAIDHGDLGTITISSPISWSSNLLTLNAANDLIINNTLTLTGTADFFGIVANDIIINSAPSWAGALLQFNAGGTLQVTTPISWSANTLHLIGGVDLIIDAPLTITGTGILVAFAQTNLEVNSTITWVQPTLTLDSMTDLFINAPLTWSANNLDLIANGDLYINDTLTLSGAATLGTNIQGDLLLNSAPSWSIPALSLNAVTDLIVNTPISWSANSLNLTANNEVQINAALTVSGTGDLLASGLVNTLVDAPINWSSSNALSISGNNTITIQDDITISSTADLNVSAPDDIFIIGCTLDLSGGGNLFLSPTVGGQLFLDNCSVITLDTANDQTYDAPATVNLIGTLNFTAGNIGFYGTPNTTIRSTDATVNATCGIFQFINGVSGSPTLGLTLNGYNAPSVNNVILFSSASSAEFFNITSQNNIALQPGASMTSLGATDAHITINAGNGFFVDAGCTLQANGPAMTGSPVTITAGDRIWFVGDGFTLQSIGPMTLIANNDIFSLATTGTIQTTGLSTNTLTLVVDNANPSRPNIGTGVFTLPQNATFNMSTTAGGKILLYAASPELANTFPTVMNGVAYTPGSFSGSTYNTGTNEFLGFWYPELPVDPPYEVIFKFSNAAVTIPPTTIETIQTALVEPVANPPQITQVLEGPQIGSAAPDPKAVCRTPPVAIQAN